jgi:hypothetical protein
MPTVLSTYLDGVRESLRAEGYGTVDEDLSSYPFRDVYVQHNASISGPYRKLVSLTVQSELSPDAVDVVTTALRHVTNDEAFDVGVVGERGYGYALVVTRDVTPDVAQYVTRGRDATETGVTIYPVLVDLAAARVAYADAAREGRLSRESEMLEEDVARHFAVDSRA